MSRTTLAVFGRRHDFSFFKPLLEAADPLLDVVIWPDPRFRDAEIAVGWETPPGLYDEMPRLRLVHGIAAGVDNIIHGLDSHPARLCRVVDPALRDGMLQFVLWSILYFHRHFDTAFARQARREWKRSPQTTAASCRVGFMGLGELGGSIATAVAELGYAVSGWSRSPKAIEGVTTFSGDEGFAPFLSTTDVLICLLPLTEATRGILAKPLFDLLPDGAALVQCGRGQHLVEQDLSDAIASGRLRGAVIDVFEQEPLPPEHPFWTTPGIVVTPHMASMANFNTVATQIAENVARLRAGEPLVNEVDRISGY